MLEIITAKNLDAAFFSARRLGDSPEIVPQILEDVRTGGDRAVREYAGRFDRANPSVFEIPRAELQAAEEKLRVTNPELYQSLTLSRDLALAFARRQRASFTDFEEELSPGLITGQRTIPVERAGVYVPAGRFPLFSSVIMGSMPAKAAGVAEVILCTPPFPYPAPECSDTGADTPWADERIMAVASLCGIDRVFAVGGAQAIAAMAYGTETIPHVDVIVGPGNKFVAAAKKLVYGEVGIDLLAGPTEVMIIADESCTPAWTAADLLAQAEHDVDAQSVLVVFSENGEDAARQTAERIRAEILEQLKKLPPESPATESLSRNGAILIASTAEEAVSLANRKAPEHLELAVSGPLQNKMASLVHNYGSLFIGHEAAEVLGDYAAGLNHTLPTSGSAHFTGGLSVRHFLKTVTTLRTADSGDNAGVQESLKTATIIGKAEGLIAHSRAAECRRGSFRQ